MAKQTTPKTDPKQQDLSPFEKRMLKAREKAAQPANKKEEAPE